MQKKEKIPLIPEENKFYKKQKDCYICKKSFSTDDDNKNILKFKVTVIILENIEKLLMIFVIWDTKHQKKWLLYFIMVLHMIIIL